MKSVVPISKNVFEQQNLPKEKILNRSLKLTTKQFVMQIYYMGHTIAIRIPTELLRKVQKTAKVKGKNRSTVIREALEFFFTRVGASVEKDPYQVLLSLMPLESSPHSDLASRSEDYLREKLHARSHPR